MHCLHSLKLLLSGNAPALANETIWCRLHKKYSMHRFYSCFFNSSTFFLTFIPDRIHPRTRLHLFKPSIQNSYWSANNVHQPGARFGTKRHHYSWGGLWHKFSFRFEASPVLGSRDHINVHYLTSVKVKGNRFTAKAEDLCNSWY